MYNGRALEEIASLDDYQLNFVFARKRDEYGRLIRRGDLPWWVEVDAEGQRVISNPVPFGDMYVKVKKRQGLSEEKAVESWKEFRKTLPKIVGASAPPGAGSYTVHG